VDLLPTLTIVTPVTRVANLPEIGRSIATALRNAGEDMPIVWWRSLASFLIVDDVTQTDRALPFLCRMTRCHVTGRVGSAERSDVLDRLAGGYVCFLDDDTTMHPEYLATVAHYMRTKPGHAIVVDQVDAAGNLRCIAAPDRVQPCMIDTGQCCVPFDLIGELRWNRDRYECDGEFYQAVYQRHPARFVFVNRTLSIYNGIPACDS